ncbi:MAG: hypothetical protein IGS50_16080 [Synechococcales cyanobacterium C42_A2020_086]|jgi:hypothetical protein|nr:hypothetical protein [Synechococcales cyanobacterium C42_A2020_086]
MYKTMIRKFLIFSMALGLGLTSFACASESLEYPTDVISRSAPVQEAAPAPVSTTIRDGEYPVQQATYDDGTGEYTLMLLNTAPGESLYRASNLQMARLTDEQIQSGVKSYLKVENGQPVLYLTEDFRIEYIHNVTETQVNPQTGQQEVVVVRQEPSFWTPFAGALAGQALGSLLFTPHYYMPPVYRPGVVLTGYGGYGRSYDQAVSSYQSRYRTPPAEVRNRQTFRTTGQIRRSPSTGTTTRPTQPTPGNRATGSGYGGSTLRRSPTSNPTKARPRTGGFGSGGARRAPRIGGRRR